MLRNEIIKILTNKILWVVLAASLMINAGLIYWQQIRADEYSNITYKDYNALMDDIQLLSNMEKKAYIEERLELLELMRDFEIYLVMPEVYEEYFEEQDIDKIRALYDTGEYLKYTDNIIDEKQLYDEGLAEISEVISYGEILKNIKKNTNKILKRFSEDTFEYERAAKSMEAYESLMDMELQHQPARGINLFVDNVTTDIMVVVCLLFSVVIAITYEREKNLLILSKSTKNGRAVHGRIKVASLVVIGFMVTVVMYGETLVLAGSLYGLGDLSRPIQSVSGYSLCSMDVSVLEYIVIYVGMKFMFFVMCAGMFFLISSIFRRAVSVYLISTAIVTGLVVLYNAISDVSYLNALKTFNPVSYGQVKEILSRYQCVEIFGHAYEKTSTYILCMCILMLISFSAGIWIYARVNEKEILRFEGFSIFKRQRLHTGMVRHEFYKVFIAYRVAIVHIVGLMVAYAAFVPAENIYYGNGNHHYDMYSSNVEGKYSEETDEYIEKQMAFVETKLAEYGDRPSGSEYLTYELAQNALDDMWKYADYLKSKPRSFYINNDGYELLTGAVGDMNSQNVVLAVFSSVFAIICFVTSMSADYERGEDKLIRSTLHGRRKYSICKCMTGLVSVGIIYISFWGVQLADVLNQYGTKYFDAPAYSMEHLSWMPEWVSIGVYIVFIYVVRFIGLLLIMAACYGLMKKLRSSAISIMVAAAIFIAPLILWFLGVDSMKYLSVFYLYY